MNSAAKQACGGAGNSRPRAGVAVIRTQWMLAAALLSAPAAVLGNGMGLASQDGFATARGDAFVATADNSSAIFYNPAGIAQLEGMQVRAGIYGIYLDPRFTPPAPANTTTYRIKENLAAAPQFFATFTPRDFPLSFGLGTYAPYGATIEWPQDTGFRSVATRAALTYATLNPVIALRLAPGLSIAAGAAINYGNIDLEQGLARYEQPLANTFRFRGDGWSAGYNLGLLWKVTEKVSLGAALRSANTMTMTGHTEIELETRIKRTERRAQAEFAFPMSAVFGLSYRPASKWNIEFDAEYTDWRTMGVVTIEHLEAPPFPIKRNVDVTLNWQESWMYKFGVTRYLGDRWHVSAGYVFNENSVPDDYYTPLAVDLDRHFLSVGAGYKGKRYSFDVAYQFGYGPARYVSGSTPSSTPGRFVGQTADGTFDFISHAVLVTVGMRF